MFIDKDQVIANLKNVFDPEISLNVYDLGLIYGIETSDVDHSVTITHTLTSAFCPYADQIISEIQTAGYVDGVHSVEIVTTFDPPFTIENVPEDTRIMMGWL